MRPPWRLLLLVLTLAAAGATTGARGQNAPANPPPAGVLTLDPDRLYQDSRFGRAIEAEMDRLRAALLAENKRLDRELAGEEAKLAARRPSIAPEEFRALADAFDEKAETIRSAQAGKLQALAQRRKDERQRFFNAVLPILAEVVTERRAAIVIEKRMVFLAADGIDITDRLIARIDALTFDSGGAQPSGSLPRDAESPPSAQ